MQSRNTHSLETIDETTSRSICRAIGERLRQNLAPQTAQLPASLQNLLDEMRHQEMQSPGSEPGTSGT